MSQKNNEEIAGLLDDIKAILLLANSDRLEEAKRKLLKAGSVESKVYELCEGASTQDIAAAIQKSPDYAAAVISSLRRKGLVRTIEREGKKVHERRL